MKTKRILLSTVLVLAVLLAACSTSQIAVALNVASMATSVAASTIQGVSGLEPGVQTQIVNYLGAVTTALGTAATDMQAGAISVAQAGAIADALLAAVVPSLPSTVPVIVRTALGAVAAGVGAFLAILQTQGVTPKTATSGGSYQFRLTFRDRGLVAQSVGYLRQARADLGLQ